MSRAARILILALAICATLGVSTASVSHIDSSPNGCSVCFTAHAVAFETPSAQLFFGPEMTGRTAFLLPANEYQACVSRVFCSRGPPPSSL
jgi:hypothetical protein